MKLKEHYIEDLVFKNKQTKMLICFVFLVFVLFLSLSCFIWIGTDYVFFEWNTSAIIIKHSQISYKLKVASLIMYITSFMQSYLVCCISWAKLR